MPHTPAAAAALAEKAYGGKRGARDLRGAVRREVEDRIAAVLVERCDDLPHAVSVDADGNMSVRLDFK